MSDSPFDTDRDHFAFTVLTAFAARPLTLPYETLVCSTS